MALYASTATPWGRAIREYAQRTSGPATLVGGGKAAPAAVALANGTAGLGFELEDSNRAGRTQPGPPFHSAALAAGEPIAAIVAGYEVMNRVALAAGPASLRRACHPTAHLGAFGAAVAAGRLMRLSAAELTNAIGLAGRADERGGSPGQVPRAGGCRKVNGSDCRSRAGGGPARRSDRNWRADGAAGVASA